MRKTLFFVFMLLAKYSVAQYCGYSSPAICNPTNTLTSPCGMCWAANDSSFTYPGLGRACIKLSGTTYDTAGAYRINLFGTAYTSFGIFPGNLSIAGLSFFLHVVGKNAACTAIDTTHLFIVCNGADTSSIIPPLGPNVTSCGFKINVTCSSVTNCAFDSATITLTSPVTSVYHHYWTRFDLIGSQPGYSIDSTSLSFIYHHNDGFAQLIVVDSAGCGDTLSFDLGQTAGPIVQPVICYSTTDTSLLSSWVSFVFERNDFLNNISTYTLFRQDSSIGSFAPVRQVGSSRGSAPGYITDAHPHPMDTTFSICQQCDMNTYHIGYNTTCGDTQINGVLFVSSELRVLRQPTLGLPYLLWTNSDPLNYDTVFVFSRNRSGHWRLRYTTTNLLANQWLDSQPDSNGMQYMLGYHLIIDCDPLRSVSHYAFSNFGKVTIADSLVVPDTAVVAPTAILGVSSAPSILVYPNPTASNLYIQAIAAGDIDMNIYDMQGRMVMGKTLYGTTINEVNVESLSADIYAVYLRPANGIAMVKRFVKQ
jgi:hypothetical protein